jgi:hypothetical protein
LDDQDHLLLDALDHLLVCRIDSGFWCEKSDFLIIEHRGNTDITPKPQAKKQGYRGYFGTSPVVQ